MIKIGFAKCTVLGSYLVLDIFYQENLFIIKNSNITIELTPSQFTGKLLRDEITLLSGWSNIIEILKHDCNKKLESCKTMFTHLKIETELKALDEIINKFKDTEE